MTLVQDYLNKTTHYKKQYGEKTLVLMQVGAFYEVYGLKETKTGIISGSEIEDFSVSCELAISDKKICVGKRNVLMSGFRDYMLDKYLKKLQSFGYTVVVYSQDEKAAGTTRSLDGIYSPGTYFTSDTVNLTNNIVCIWMHEYKKTMIIGLSCIDIFTGKSVIFEYETEYKNYSTSYDELERFVSVYNPVEVIIVHNVEDSYVKNMVQYASFSTESIHIVSLLGEDSKALKAQHCEKQIYQVEMLQRFYNEYDDAYFLTYAIATQSFCYLLDFVYDHNPNLVYKIAWPTFENHTNRMILGNHSLKQLNMIHSDVSQGKVSSVSHFMNRCVTSMGKRLLHTSLVSPTIDEEYLEMEYSMVEYLVGAEEVNGEIRERMKQVKDIEKLTRKLVLKKITPQDLYYLHETIKYIGVLYKYCKKDKTLMGYIENKQLVGVDKTCREINAILEATLNLSKCREISTLDFEDNFIKTGVCADHDMMVDNCDNAVELLEQLRIFFHEHVAKYEKKQKTTEYVKIHKTDRMGYSLIATKRRTELLKTRFKTLPSSFKPSFNGAGGKEYELDLEGVSYTKATGSYYTIDSAQIRKACGDILTTKKIMNDHLGILYRKLLERLLLHVESMESIISFVSLIDVISCKAYIAKKYNYTRPVLCEAESSFFKVEGLRHPLIEQILQEEIYISNNVQLDEEQKGILLYGTNAVGKSSFIKSIGISIILAQAGFFVPCKRLAFKPYKHIYTRILGNDNIFKGLSTFAVEMLELKNILNGSTKDSLILGDELCSGTETDSAISIFLAGVEELYQKEASFIFATHFHEIVYYEEVLSKERLKLKHMAVAYNKALDMLVYERKLQDGPGESMYGLEVCKSLHLPSLFLERAHEIRNKYSKQKSVLEYKSSHFNAKKIKGMCERCNTSIGEEVHHLQHQKVANEDGFIELEGGHKNHPGNLMSVCRKCHDELHKHEGGHIRQKTSIGYQLMEL
jgi:DNA mismatch repair protein MutS